MSWLFLALLVLAPQTPERLCEGDRPRVSPGGEWVAFHRWVKTGEFGRWGEEETRGEVWARNLASGEEKRLSKDGWLSGWIDASTAVLHDGTTVAVSGKASAVVKPPPDVFPRNRSWSPGGKRLAYFPLVNWGDKSGDRRIFIVEGSGAPLPVDLGHELITEDEGILAWSPDGKRLMFHQEFFRPGNVPVRRIGVIDVATGRHAFVGEGDRTGDRYRAWGESPGTWDAKGDRFVFVTGRGGREGEVHVSNAEGSEVHQLTEDEESKWCPVLDPLGRRVAFCSGRWELASEEVRGEDRFPIYEMVKGRIRILDLYTGREVDAKPAGKGMGIHLAWLADGSGLVFDWGGDLFRATLPAPEKLAANVPIVAKPALTPKQRVLKALTSSREAIVKWGAEESQKLKDPQLVSALRDALNRTKKAGQINAERELLFALRNLNAREAAPEIIGSIQSTHEGSRTLALSIVGEWKLKEATEILLKTLERLPEDKTNVYAAGALAWFDHEAGWKLLGRYLEVRDKSIRGSVIYSIEGLRDPKALPLLIRLVDDTEVLYTSYQGQWQVGDQAERALATITGQTFDRRPIDWLTWWNRQEGKLPTVPSPNPALKKLDAEMERREKEWQKQFEGK